MSTSRRSFLKFFGIGVPAIAATSVAGSVPLLEKSEASVRDNFLVKEWEQDGITYLEYSFPPVVQAMFKTQDRKRAIYRPIRRINVISQKELIDIDRSMVQLVDGNSEYENIYTNVISEEKITDALLIQQHSKYAKMHLQAKYSPWKNAYLYMVRIEEHPELFGIMINKDRLIVERDNYTCY